MLGNHLAVELFLELVRAKEFCRFRPHIFCDGPLVFSSAVLSLSSMTPSRVFLDNDVQETRDYLCW